MGKIRVTMKQNRLSLSDVEWKDFKIKTLFNVTNSKPYHKESLESQLIGIPYITRTSLDNGVEDTVLTNKVFKINKGNAISLGAENADFFYQSVDYITGNKMYRIGNKYINKFIGLFLVQAFRTSIKDSGFGYGKGLTGTRFKDRSVILPIDDEDKPNWQFMEDYIKQELKDIAQKIIDYYELKMLETNIDLVGLEEHVEWKEFWLEDIVVINSGVRLTKADQESGDMPFIGSSDSNNGITGFVRNTNSSLDKNVLGVNYNGSVVESFYHPYECIFSDDVKRIHWKDKRQENKYSYLFLKQAILQQKEKYAYGYKFNAKRMKRQKILLPIVGDGQPDYEYMKKYIQIQEIRMQFQILNYYRRLIKSI